MKTSVRIYGYHAFESVVLGYDNRAGELAPVLNIVGDRMLSAEGRLFDTSGKSGGHAWDPLSKSTSKRKSIRGERKPLVRTGHERDSLSRRGASDNIFRVTRSYVIIGSTAAGVEYQATGTRHMPARPPIQFTDKQALDWTGLISDFIFEGATPHV